MNHLLPEEHPLVIQPKLATALGLNEAIVIHQVHYWLIKNATAGRNFHDGRYWTFNSIDAWQEESFPWWSYDTVKRTFAKLVNSGILLTGNYNKRAGDRTKWYSIDYRALVANCPATDYEKLVTTPPNRPIGQNAPSNRAKCTKQEGKIHQALPETYPETSTEEEERAREVVSCTISGKSQTEPGNDSSSFTSLIEKMNTHLPDKPKKKHHDALVELFEEYGESITEGVDYAFAEGLAADEWYSGIKDGVAKSANWGSVMTALPDVLAAWARKRAEEARYPNLNDRPPCPSCGSSMFSQGSVQECRSCREWFKLVDDQWEPHEPKPILCPVCGEVLEKDEACLHPGIVEECGFCDNKWAIFSAEEIRYDGEGEPTPAPFEVTCPKCDPEKHTMNITGKVKWYPNEEKPRSCNWYQCRARLTPEEFEEAYAAKRLAMVGE